MVCYLVDMLIVRICFAFTCVANHLRRRAVSPYNVRGFRRIPEEKEPEGCLGYTHDLFLRDSPGLLRKMKKEVYVKKDKDKHVERAEESPKKKVKIGKTPKKRPRSESPETRVNGERRDARRPSESHLGDSALRISDMQPSSRLSFELAASLGQHSSSLQNLLSGSHARQLQLDNLTAGVAGRNFSSGLSQPFGLAQLERLHASSTSYPRLPSLNQPLFAQREIPGFPRPESHRASSGIGSLGSELSNEELIQQLALQRQMEFRHQQQQALLQHRRESVGAPSAAQSVLETLRSQRHLGSSLPLDRESFGLSSLAGGPQSQRSLQTMENSSMLGDRSNPTASSTAMARVLVNQQVLQDSNISTAPARLQNRATPLCRHTPLYGSQGSDATRPLVETGGMYIGGQQRSIADLPAVGAEERLRRSLLLQALWEAEAKAKR